jgi:hypothetical protein
VLHGTASAEEHAVVDEHLVTCPVCALQLRVAGAKDAEGTARAAFEARQNERVVARALAEVGRTRSTPLGLGRLPRWAFAAAALLLVAGVAGAAWIIHDLDGPTPASQAPGALARAVVALPARTTEKVEPHQSPPSVTVQEPAVAERAAAARPSPAEPSASALFEQGTALRAQNKRAAAITVFGKLQRAYPESRESRLSYALVGTLLLEERRAAEALFQFDRHLALRGEAQQEALAGRASAYQQMGRATDEANAWRRLLAAHPQSIYATRAKQRLAALAASP